MYKKIFFSYTTTILVLTVIICLVFINTDKNHIIEKQSESLISIGNLLRYNLEDKYLDYAERLDELAQEYADTLNITISILDNSGEIIESSDLIDAERLYYAEKIIEELEDGSKISVGYSENFDTECMYLTIPVTIDNTSAVLKISKPIHSTDQVKYEVVINILWIVGLTGFISLVFIMLLTNRLAKKIDSFILVTKEIANGNFNLKVPLQNDEYLYKLAISFNNMIKEIGSTVNLLENKNLKLESIVDSMINGVIAVDNKKNIILINPICYRIFNIKQKEALGKKIYEIIKNEEVLNLLSSTIKNNISMIDEIVLSSELDGVIYLRIYTNPIIDTELQEGSIGTLIVFQDITQIRKLEQHRSDFVSNVTHELKTPLTSIIGFADTLKSGAVNDPENLIRFIDIISIEANRLYRLILDILSLSEIETRRTDDDMNFEKVTDITNVVLDMLKSTAEQKNLKINVNISQNIPLFLCNKDRISQMLINLLDNSIKYTEQGEVNLTIYSTNENLEIVVSDTGIGMPEGSLVRIFERFYRVDKGRSRKAGGTGLGLSIVKHIVMLYDGNVNVKSKEGEGTEFKIILPYKTL